MSKRLKPIHPVRITVSKAPVYEKKIVPTLEGDDAEVNGRLVAYKLTNDSFVRGFASAIATDIRLWEDPARSIETMIFAGFTLIEFKSAGVDGKNLEVIEAAWKAYPHSFGFPVEVCDMTGALDIRIIQGTVRYRFGTWIARANKMTASATSGSHDAIEKLLRKIMAGETGGGCVINSRDKVDLYDFKFVHLPGAQSIHFKES